MDGAGDELLARARLAVDHDGRTRGRDLLDGREHPHHALIGGDDAIDVPVPVEFGAEPVDLRGELTDADGLLDRELELVQIERLRHVFRGAGLHRLDCCSNIAVGSEHDDREDMTIRTQAA
jgi:hypothetical protein